MQTLPARYVALVSVLAERADDRCSWLGDVGFRLAPALVDVGAWAARLTEARWRGMHPDLMPFAEDGFGNQFCFLVDPPSGQPTGAVFYWMYETYRAIPVASTFDAFLRWIAITASVTAGRGHPLIDEAHVRDEILPACAAAGLSMEASDILHASDLTPAGVHAELLRVDRHAAGAALARAAHRARQDRHIEALTMCDTALDAFPDFSAAQGLKARLFLDDGDPRAVPALLDTLRLPLSYNADPMMPFFRELPEVDPTWVTEALNTHPNVKDYVGLDPLWTLVLRDDPTAPVSWVHVALDYAESGDLKRAATAATNGLLLGINKEIETEIHGLLEELYRSLGWKWHTAVSARWAPAR